MARSKTTSPKGGKAKRRARVREGNSEFPSVYCARKLCRDIFNPFAGNLILRPGECRLSHVGLSVSRYIPSVETPFPAMGPFHTYNTSVVALIIAFPFW